VIEVHKTCISILKHVFFEDVYLRFLLFCQRVQNYPQSHKSSAELYVRQTVDAQKPEVSFFSVPSNWHLKIK
jgi:hypothetical protein